MQSRAGDPAPAFSGVVPASGASGDTVVVELAGASGLWPGLAVRLVREGLADALPLEVEWLDPAVASAGFDLTGLAGGDWDVVVENADGQTTVVVGGFRVEGAVTPAPTRPTGVALAQNFPNPFNPSTSIRFQVPDPASVTLEILDLRGRRVRELLEGPLAAGYHTVPWDGTDDAGVAVASGVYLYRLRVGAEERVRRMLLVR